ncbi:hypothetical protein FVA74_02415 [Salinibacterium sp. dk2585]|uniref:hypothetical protein n=1 Tax=unclassified Salinibacterium TaxID=2632331 RepID=UPI0011C25587|nr:MULTISPECIES: hypothetical protein [unclassified Salinibacterium]QEE60549.1 hypothetical protein FVA74_02415 [Salinibacterium sp. dk2585]TXK55621.1 hypothetical protein FVP63_02560 [Salinibacterium sp. dk5596]
MSKSFWTRESTDLWTTIAAGAIAAVIVIVVTVLRMLDLFSVDGIAARVPIPDGLGAELPLGGNPVESVVFEAQITSQDLARATVDSLAAAIIIPALAYLAVIGCAIAFCINLMRGRSFTRGNTRLVFATALIVLLGALFTQWATIMGANGTYAALGAEFDGQSAVMDDFWPAYLAAMGIAAVAIAFRRGERLQRDTEGLV